GEDRVVRLHDVATGKLEKNLTGPTGLVYSVAISPDGKWLAAAGAASGNAAPNAFVWNLEAGRVHISIRAHADSVYQIAFSPDSSSFATCGSDRVAKLFRLTGAEAKTFMGHADKVTCLAFNKDGKVLATGSEDHSLRLWDVESAKTVRTLRGHEKDVT